MSDPVQTEPIKTLPLVFEEPRGPRGPKPKPPRHLADLTLAERREVATALGHPAYRAGQLSTHYFERLVDRPDEMTDLPKAVRSELVTGLLPTILLLLAGVGCAIALLSDPAEARILEALGQPWDVVPALGESATGGWGTPRLAASCSCPAAGRTGSGPGTRPPGCS